MATMTTLEIPDTRAAELIAADRAMRAFGAMMEWAIEVPGRWIIGPGIQPGGGYYIGHGRRRGGDRMFRAPTLPGVILDAHAELVRLNEINP